MVIVVFLILSFIGTFANAHLDITTARAGSCPAFEIFWIARCAQGLPIRFRQKHIRRGSILLRGG